MPTPPASDAPGDRTALEPIHVLRPRGTDALAQLLDDIRQDKDYRSHVAVAAPVSHTPTDGETEELPPVLGGKTEELPAPDGDTRLPRPVDRPRLVGLGRVGCGGARLASASAGRAHCCRL